MTDRAIVAVVTDLMFRSRLEEPLRRLGREAVFVDTLDAARHAFAEGAPLAVIDLHAGGIDWRAVVELAKERGVPVLAFGRHTEAALLRAAREAGCDRVVARSQLVEELPRLIEELAPAAP